MQQRDREGAFSATPRSGRKRFKQARTNRCAACSGRRSRRRGWLGERPAGSAHSVLRKLHLLAVSATSCCAERPLAVFFS